MILQTPVNIERADISLDNTSKIMLTGSCFSEHVGEHLLHELNQGMVDVNPFGVLYNPISIAQALRLLMAEDGRAKLAEHVFLGQDNLWHSWLHTTHFSGKTKEECITKILYRYNQAKKFLKGATLLCITFGTTRCYNHQGMVVANCHKEPQQRFIELEPTMEELIMLWREVICELKQFNPNISICLTVSPFRYRKYGFHESQVQKAKLLLLTDALKEECMYFPAYEIMMDELRDYRFYANDMLHPSELAVEIIFERFKEWIFTKQLKELATLNQKAWRRSQHRPLQEGVL